MPCGGKGDPIREALAAMSREQRGKALLYLCLKLGEIGWRWSNERPAGSKKTPPGSDWKAVIRAGLTPRGSTKG